MPVDFAEQITRKFSPRKLSIVEFVESDEFCNRPLYPHQRVFLKLIRLEEMEGWEEDILSEWISGGYQGEVEISPFIRERRDFLRENGYKHFKEIYMVGGRRGGKGYVTGLFTALRLWETMQLGDPGAHYGVDPSREIYFTVVAASLDQARQYQFNDIKNIAGSCPPLRSAIPSLLEESFSVHTEADLKYVERLRKSGVKVAANFAKLRVKPLAAQAGTVRGSASLVVIFDEMAHMIGTDGKASAEEVYTAATPATRTFRQDATIFCNSSPYTKEGQFYENIQNAMKTGTIEYPDAQVPAYPHVMHVKFPSWEMYRNYGKDPDRRFKQAIMVSPDWPDALCPSTADKAVRAEERLEEQKNPETYRVEYRAEWADVIDAYLNPTNVDKAFSTAYEPTDGGRFMYMYHGHCDPSSTTAGFGMALAHIEQQPSIYFEDAMDDHIVFDLVKKWDPADFENHTINYIAVQEEILEKINLYRPNRFTFDQFNSIGMIQWLREQTGNMGISTQLGQNVATKNKNWEMWENFKTALNLGFVHIPVACGTESIYTGWGEDSHYAMRELKALQKKNGRVENQDAGPTTTDDIAVCIAQCTHELIGSYVSNYAQRQLGNAVLQTGALGGYGIGRPSAGRLSQNPREALNDYYRGSRASTQVDPSRSGFRPSRHR